VADLQKGGKINWSPFFSGTNTGIGSPGSDDGPRKL